MLRNGEFVGQNADSRHRTAVTLSGQYDLGRTAVSVIQDSTDGNSALVVCGRELRRITVLDGYESLEHSITPIWLTSRDEVRLYFPYKSLSQVLTIRQPPYQQPTINAAARVPNLPYLRVTGLGSSLICVTGDQLLISSLTSQSQVVPRRIKTNGNPRRIAYSRYLNKLVVALDQISFDGDRTFEEPLTRRYIRQALQFVDPDNESPISRQDVMEGLIRIADVDEKITCILNWTPTDERKHYEMIVMGTEIEAVDTEQCSGRVLLINAKEVKDGQYSSVKLKTVRNYPGKPVYSICPFGLSSLLVAAGREVMMLRLDIMNRKWTQVTKLSLPSSAVSLATHGRLIYAATEYHSLTTMEFDGEKMISYANDMEARNASRVVACDNGSAIITTPSSGGGRIVGFSERVENKQYKVLFEVNLALSTSCLKPGFTTPITDIPHRCFYGATLDGTMYYLTTLGDGEWRLLHFVEGLTKTRRNTGFSGRRHRKAAVLGTKPSKLRPWDMHIRGDALTRLFLRGPQGLRHLLWREPDQDDLFENFATAKERYRHFQTLAEAVIGVTSDPVSAVAKWVRKLLQL